MTETTAAPWTPSAADIETARITDFARFVTARTGLEFPDYRSLWQWSVDDIAGFWRAVWDYFDLGAAPGEALAEPTMPGARWFPEVRLNYVDRVARQARTDRPAILDIGEDAPLRELSWAELLTRTDAFARTLRAHGVRAGDRVAGYLPDIPEAVIAFLATASIGAIWSACGQDYSPQAALDRLGQLEPVVLVTADGYRYGGREHDRRAEIAAVRAGLPSVRATVAVSRLGYTVPGAVAWEDASAGGAAE
ncbi:AMP-binding protein, partial [Nocardia sp. CC201C]|uniref:AMP-binding protein n=1 Tax=Nocardia sp. CC201C TaxID=3044575 RepID=UPI0024A9BF4A